MKNEGVVADYQQYPHSLLTKKSTKFSPLKKNLLSISALDAKGMRVAFIDGQVIMWPKGNTIDDAVVIGEQELRIVQIKGTSRTILNP